MKATDADETADGLSVATLRCATAARWLSTSATALAVLVMVLALAVETLELVALRLLQLNEDIMSNESLRQERRQLQRKALKKQQAANQTYQHAHVTVGKIAMELAGAYYDEQAHNDAFYNHWPDLDLFVQAEWHNFIPIARQVLGKMLADVSLPEAAKEQVFEALVADRTLPRPDNINFGAASPLH